jgi:hypothetical protein
MGHLVLDCPVPSKLLDNCPNKTDKEFTTMRLVIFPSRLLSNESLIVFLLETRYTAVTCDPNDFK